MEKNKSTSSSNFWAKWDKPKKVRVITLTALAFIVLLVVVPIITYYNIQSDETQVISSPDNNVANNTILAPVDPLPFVLSSKVGRIERVGSSFFKRESGIPTMLKKDDPKNPPQSTQTVLVERLTGTQMSKPFTVEKGYRYAKIWVNNKGKQRIAISISKDSPTGDLMTERVVTIAGGTNWSIYTTKPWESGTYYVNFTSNGSPIQGVAVARVGARLAELNS
ncbi:hypothetical protein QCD85_20895 [Paenibacillus sp. PsM32]|uniref:hypothetical protein n=1 Tax=Paenibacillus sp. PsM32 TaxID=3030536 RepID=UPI00263BC277|nr:hypothetical protein [Paenibacillus sp. PsM32]MDN4620587.1 hypothetical protein [Paenibacillus sp. PsM32]